MPFFSKFSTKFLSKSMPSSVNLPFSSPQAPPHISPGRPPISIRTDLWTTLAVIFRICCHFCANQNFIKNQTAQKATRNHKKMNQGWFVIHFGTHFGTLSVSFFMFFYQSRKSWKSHKNRCFFNDFAVLRAHFSHQILINISCFFWQCFWGLIFHIFLRLYAKKSDFGTPMEAGWGQNGTQNPPNGVKVAPFSQRCARLCAFLLPIGFQHRFRTAAGEHFGKFFVILHKFKWNLKNWTPFSWF